MIFCIPVYGIARISPSEIDTREYNTKGDCVPNYRENFLWFCNIWLGRIILEEKKKCKNFCCILATRSPILSATPTCSPKRDNRLLERGIE